MCEQGVDRVREFVVGAVEQQGELPHLRVGEGVAVGWHAAAADAEGCLPVEFAGLLGDMAVIFSELCSGKPTAAQINALPVRVRTIFFAWLQGEVMSPEAVTGAGQTQVTPLRSARAG